MQVHLLPGLVGMVTTEIEKFHLRVFILVNVAVRSLVVRNVVEGHPRRLPTQLVPHKSQTGSV